MSRFHGALRRAVVAQLKAWSPLAPIYSTPPANTAPPLTLVGRIIAEPPECKGDPSGWYSIAIESWVKSHSATDLDTITDAVAVTLDAKRLPTLAGASTLDLVGEEETMNPDDPGGPTLGRVQTFRIFIQ